jgi:hypothetical protein
MQTNQAFYFNIQNSGDCMIWFDSSLGDIVNWTVRMNLVFSNEPETGDGEIWPSDVLWDVFVIGIERADWTVWGAPYCSTVSTIEPIVLKVLAGHWRDIGVPLCERPAPIYVGKCPE